MWWTSYTLEICSAWYMVFLGLTEFFKFSFFSSMVHWCILFSIGFTLGSRGALFVSYFVFLICLVSWFSHRLKYPCFEHLGHNFSLARHSENRGTPLVHIVDTILACDVTQKIFLPLGPCFSACPVTLDFECWTKLSANHLVWVL